MGNLLKKTRDLLKNRKRAAIVAVCAVAAAAALAAAAAAIYANAVDAFGAKRQILPSSYSLSYTVGFDDPNVKILRVGIGIDISKLSKDGLIMLYKGLADATPDSCSDGSGADVPFDDAPQSVTIGPIEPGVSHIDLSYFVRIGNEGSTQWGDTQFTNGDLYGDLLVFSGERVLMTPMMDAADMFSMEKYIGNVSFRLDRDYGFDAIMPFSPAPSGECAFSVDKPKWGVFNSISKSSFCFGTFEKIDLDGIKSLYMDKGIGGPPPRVPFEALASLIGYYGDVFGELDDGVPLVLLRSNPADGSMILGGVGAGGGAISIDMLLAEQCQVLSSTLLHLYFDSKIKAPNLRYAPNNWLYRGFSELHVDKSAESLPDEARERFSIGNLSAGETNYLRYLYFSLKEPGFLVLNPTMEGNMLEAQDDFYQYVKSPLMVDYIDSVIKANGGEGFAKTLVGACGAEKEADLSRILRKACGSGYDSVMNCFSGGELIPNYQNLNIDGKMGDFDVIDLLLLDEQRYSSWFEYRRIFYTYVPLVILRKDKFREAAAEAGASYNTPEIESHVRGFSDTLDQLLLQIGMFAKLAGVDDITMPNSAVDMFNNDSYEKWRVFCDGIGFVNRPLAG